jgi:riboflavin kinase/FMN adenylyltransferase
VGQPSRLSVPSSEDKQDACPTFSGVLNLGRRPTFENRRHNRILEVHIFDFERDIYGAEIEVIFHQKLRGEQKFNSVDELKNQIACDVQSARRLLQ